MRVPYFKILWAFSFNIIFLLLAFYIFQVSVFTQGNYSLEDQTKKIDKLSKENEVLEINYSKLNSLSNIENYFSTGNYVKANQIKYLQVSGGPVASK